ncbi:hypoxanthine phosphoribosyltransferase [Lewinella marina]|uniref:Hypoxanthine phosphoribosyltransferase n=1 Tax=Neolewinella marina TaxID=438751 RepID=A0A2G0CJZ2_9BACT|nr:hypoxanthine phosphoribosyltransferase [Neolewinella marina]NJB84529.1 hypoxanthine phosphoribosyltransferase [Neolewinella marina]PHL00286.1 hypoxanthine phosphoribosyltransferase [Neolewinella marina]
MSAPITNRIQLHELHFRPFLSAEELESRVRELGEELSRRLYGGDPCFVVMLKGAFVFAADLLRASGLHGEVCFVRTSSYSGTRSEGQVKLLIPPEAELIRGKDIVLVEDIIDSGLTMQAFLPMLRELQPRSITLVTLLHKPEAQQVPVPVDLVGFTIPSKFVVGYGLDYDGLGRNLPAIYQLDESY